MTSNLKALSALIAFLLILPTQPIADHISVVRVIDDDSICAATDKTEVNIRLVGIDAPEKSKKKSANPGSRLDKATKYLAKLVLNKTITIKEYGTDRYGRILGLVFVNGTNVNLKMVKAGLAEVYRGIGSEANSLYICTSPVRIP